MHSTDDRARWLAREILPHEGALRAWLSRKPIVGLDIDDIVQETYARLSNATSIDNIRDPRSYMFSTAYSVILTYLRRSRVVAMHSLAQFENEEFVIDEPSPEAIAVDRDELYRLGQAIAELPPRIREVFILRRVEELSSREIAQKLGVSTKTVENQMAAAFQRLAKKLGRGGKHPAGASRDESQGNRNAHATRDQSGD